MKVLIAVSCLLAAASAGLLGHSAVVHPLSYAAPIGHYAGPQHLPVIGPNGVPLEEPAVVAAKAHHAAAHIEAQARNGDLAVVAHAAPSIAYGAHVAGPAVVSAYAAPVAHYAGPQHLPVIGANGVPVDEPAVSIARANHAVHHIDAKARNGDLAVVAHGVAAPAIAYGAHVAAPVVSAYSGHIAAPVVAAHGVPVPLDTPEVAAAKVAHAAAHVDAKLRNGDLHYAHPLVHYRKRRGILHGYSAAPVAISAYAAPVNHYAGPQHLPVIGPNGVPLEEPAVVAAKAHHAAAHVEAAARNGDLAVVAHGVASPAIAYGAHVAGPAVVSAYAAPVAHYAGPQHLPVIGANGVPVDEPAVSIARANHAVHHIDAKARNGDLAVVAHSAPAIAYGAHVAGPAVVSAYAAPVAHYAGPQHLPVIGPNGVPLEEPAVAAAKAHHAAAHIEAKVRNGDLGVIAHSAHIL